MEPEVQQPEQVPQEPQPQETPIDPRQAVELAAQQFGVSPEHLESAMRLQAENQRVYEENRRRARDLELREAQIEALSAERQRYLPPQPTYDDVDPITRRVLERLDRIDNRFDQQERQDRERLESEANAKRLGDELHSHYESVMRSVPSQNQMDAQRFFGGMAELWPDGPPNGVTPARAVEITARYLGLQTSGSAPAYPAFRGNPYRDPRAQFVVPTGGGSATNGAPPVAAGQDFSPQKPGETTEQYHQRLQRSFQELGSMKLPDGVRVSSSG